ncbi:MAG: quinolinate synthase NadA [Candidatus Aminicenantes bacterium]|nr:quinolinate synthase NadA [Candidatus Aminicenantes bacterium]
MKKEEIRDRIKVLKKEKDVIILAHNYQIEEVQDTADFLGDSLGLSIEASKVKEKVILFCGVHFMAETAAILAPDKTVLTPDPGAGCPMADMITGKEMREWKEANPGLEAVCYVNTTAEVKAECDICCTSSNALEVVESLKGDKVLFAPDKNLAAYVARHSSKKIIPWDGYCYVHNNILPRHIQEEKRLHPAAEVWVHPECRPEVIELADKVFSTGGMVKEAQKTEKKEAIIGTEIDMITRLKRVNPAISYYPAKSNAVCSNMKKINMAKILRSLENMVFEVKVPGEIAQRAKKAIERMIAV